MASLGDRIRERRKELRLSQGDLAERAGMTASFVSQESGEIGRLNGDVYESLWPWGEGRRVIWTHK